MPFQKGQSGNPGGKKSPVRKELDALLDRHYPVPKRARSIQRLVELQDDADPDVAMDAIKTLLAYTYGRPTERKEISGPDGGPVEVDDARDRLAARLAALAAASGDSGGGGGSDAG